MTPGGSAPEIWGGIECTINRVGGRARSQLEDSGHLERIESDLEAIAGLGLDALRYPVLWESVQPTPDTEDFTHADRALAHLRTSAMRPVVGLLHHGSGPQWTDLADPGFSDRFGRYAASVIDRYPWLEDFTPVNEPLTTARFSGLYGHWYPHARDDRMFVRILLAQVRATTLAMAAIRRRVPHARLIQTEDLGRAGGTARVRAQVEFENVRRWLTFDLLCGRVRAGHPMYDYLVRHGGRPAELARLADHPCPPDVVGLNHYPRSNRWLDHRQSLHPVATHGGNGRQRYADVAAFEAPGADVPDLSSLIGEAWRRYGIPVAVTEVHVPGDTAGQVAWWNEAVAAAEEARAEGTDVTAVTTWSLLGSYDWDTLCTSGADTDVTYEPGAFEVVDRRLRETALARAIRARTGQRMPLPAA